MLSSEVSLACGGPPTPVLSTHKDDGTQVGIFISQEQIEQTEEWRPEDGEPPLKVSSAYKIVQEWGRQQYARYDGVNVRELSLKKYGCSDVINRWYYIVDLNPVIDGNGLWGSGNWAAVLMDGTVIGPKAF
ncbi:hypothetical protein GCM10011352_34980 [Marinobacterium zhoushanense]|uniref:Uncharacterized protein n=2 Tax=Marinobacterium zhoushanense TaxID=1679163 RepID=A0ABQ1KSF4_9GAMM|nr:hypothetical protein GCM10011352_34980 [Marinobacterium zhoushanense]